jgi:hypothetical protein
MGKPAVGNRRDNEADLRLAQTEGGLNHEYTEGF